MTDTSDPKAKTARRKFTPVEIAFYVFMAVGLGLFILGLFLHWNFLNGS